MAIDSIDCQIIRSSTLGFKEYSRSANNLKFWLILRIIYIKFDMARMRLPVKNGLYLHFLRTFGRKQIGDFSKCAI